MALAGRTERVNCLPETETVQEVPYYLIRLYLIRSEEVSVVRSYLRSMTTIVVVDDDGGDGDDDGRAAA